MMANSGPRHGIMAALYPDSSILRRRAIPNDCGRAGGSNSPRVGLRLFNVHETKNAVLNEEA